MAFKIDDRPLTIVRRPNQILGSKSLPINVNGTENIHSLHMSAAASSDISLPRIIKGLDYIILRLAEAESTIASCRLDLIQVLRTHTAISVIADRKYLSRNVMR